MKNPYSAELTAQIAARKAQLEPRGEMIRLHFKDAFRLCDVVIVQAMRKFGGALPEDITRRDPQAQAWGYWLRDMKKAIDASDGTPPDLIPLPPLPTWLDMSPALAALCESVGVRV